VKKVKQMASDVLPKKRKGMITGLDQALSCYHADPGAIAAGDAEPNTNKKLKSPKPGPPERPQSKPIKESHIAQGNSSTRNGVDSMLEKSKSSDNAMANKKKLAEKQSEVDSNNKHRTSKEPKDTETALIYDDEDAPSTDDSEEEEIDDQTEALLKGFESDDDDEKDPEDQGYEAGEDIPKIDKKTRKKVKAVEKASSSGKPGVVYIGRIPHGFYEQEMRQYFSQFGTITNLRLSRNRKTGNSKHFAFIEFESAEVAEIVSQAMDNYLLFGHILKCKMVALEQVHKSLWVGANRRFKKVPWNKLEGRKLQQGMTEEGWNKRIEREENRRADKKAALKLMGYDFESPKLKSVKDALKKSQQSLLATTGDEPDQEELKAIEASEELEDQPQLAKIKKNKKKKNAANGDVDQVQDPTPAVGLPSKKKKSAAEKSSENVVGAKGKKKSVLANHASTELVDKPRKVKKSKKETTT
jgi:nucleolar protein 15